MEDPLSIAPDAVAEETEEIDSKIALRALVADVLRDESKRDIQQAIDEAFQHDMHQDTQHQQMYHEAQHDAHDPHVSVTEVEVEFKRDFVSLKLFFCSFRHSLLY